MCSFLRPVLPIFRFQHTIRPAFRQGPFARAPRRGRGALASRRPGKTAEERMGVLPRGKETHCYKGRCSTKQSYQNSSTTKVQLQQGTQQSGQICFSGFHKKGVPFLQLRKTSVNSKWAWRESHTERIALAQSLKHTFGSFSELTLYPSYLCPIVTVFDAPTLSIPFPIICTDDPSPLTEISLALTVRSVCANVALTLTVFP